jgi:hypothetical protein
MAKGNPHANGRSHEGELFDLAALTALIALPP